MRFKANTQCRRCDAPLGRKQRVFCSVACMHGRMPPRAAHFDITQDRRDEAVEMFGGPDGSLDPIALAIAMEEAS